MFMPSITYIVCTLLYSSYLPGVGVNVDHEGHSPRMRLFHCTKTELTPTIAPNVSNSNALFLIVENCVRALLLLTLIH